MSSDGLIVGVVQYRMPLLSVLPTHRLDGALQPSLTLLTLCTSGGRRVRGCIAMQRKTRPEFVVSSCTLCGNPARVNAPRTPPPPIFVVGTCESWRHDGVRAGMARKAEGRNGQLAKSRRDGATTQRDS